MEDLALHHFLMGLHPRVSTIVRCRSPKNLNEAINFALSEEKIQQSFYKSTSSHVKPNQFVPNRNIVNKNYPRQVNNANYYNQNTSSSRNIPFCRYCKKAGHFLENCKLREFNNNKRNSGGFNPFTPIQPSTSTFKPNPRVNHIEEESRDEVDNNNENLNY
ncbi:hypothetical protein K1T71_008138 [Dendrolimus kikuchii]|uniref:Uncharacterized protein n=2 Tax=Dendrolimus kikuchii TaxID=765133 RepID=A0ACC1CEG5_9NEOP|nr:hypothetical protein K1T71_014585 [Dendrolimus kikuchii]KAJ0175964.1 hypothetical protein K1T71_008138 [Dendrolimus kikuchii]